MTKKEIESWLDNNGWKFQGDIWTDHKHTIEIELKNGDLIARANGLKTYARMGGFTPSVAKGWDCKYNILSYNNIVIYGKYV